MNFTTIKNTVYQFYQLEKKFYYRGGRGQEEVFTGRIIRFFPRVFLIETSKGEIKCFSYVDFFVKLLKII